jgi:hypothetical protein
MEHKGTKTALLLGTVKIQNKAYSIELYSWNKFHPFVPTAEYAGKIMKEKYSFFS